jgi:hypothetical protein
MSDTTTVRAYPDRPGVGGAARPDPDSLRGPQAPARALFDNPDIPAGRPVDDPWTRCRAA